MDHSDAVARRGNADVHLAVVAELDPATHRLRKTSLLMDARVKPAHDELEAVQSWWLFEI